MLWGLRQHCCSEDESFLTPCQIVCRVHWKISGPLFKERPCAKMLQHVKQPHSLLGYMLRLR